MEAPAMLSWEMHGSSCQLQPNRAARGTTGQSTQRQEKETDAKNSDREGGATAGMVVLWGRAGHH